MRSLSIVLLDAHFVHIVEAFNKCSNDRHDQNIRTNIACLWLSPQVERDFSLVPAGCPV
jgi:hypothetical protein